MSTCGHISPASSLAVIHKFDYVFAENGTVQYKNGKLLSKHVSEAGMLLIKCLEGITQDCMHVACCTSLQLMVRTSVFTHRRSFFFLNYFNQLY